ncbi:MAG: hypothetical protein ISS90_00590 [Candidatus Omnitrophica bacterium]|nr:hypothetical protein [Candidatus Omnitrophota bacterium]
MEVKSANAATTILFGAGILLLLASAFDLVPKLDNALVFFGIACFIVGGIIKRIKGGGCC